MITDSSRCGGVLIIISSLRKLCVLSVSAVKRRVKSFTAETLRTQSFRREFKLGHHWSMHRVCVALWLGPPVLHDASYIFL
jgi:hypothetical protein